MRQTKVCSNRVFVPGVHTSPRRSENGRGREGEGEGGEENDMRLRIISLKGSTL